jgi:hypothetical protein
MYHTMWCLAAGRYLDVHDLETLEKFFSIFVGLDPEKTQLC